MLFCCIDEVKMRFGDATFIILMRLPRIMTGMMLVCGNMHHTVWQMLPQKDELLTLQQFLMYSLRDGTVTANIENFGKIAIILFLCIIS